MATFNATMVSGQNHINSDVEEYAFFYSKSFKEIFGFRQKDNPKKAHKSYLKLKHGKYEIFLRYKALNGVGSQDVALSYTNLCRLGIDLSKSPNNIVEITKSSWIKYNMYNQDDGRRWLFIFGFFGFLFAISIAVASFVISLIK